MTVQHPKARAGAGKPSPRSLPPTRWLIIGGLAIACVIAAALIAISLAGGRDKKSAPPPAVSTRGTKLFAGIPQTGTLLGRADAPVTLVEYADLQCPYCAQFSRTGLAGLVREYVRKGKLRIEYRPIAFIGPESAIGVRAVLAAGEQNRAWNMSELLYEQQGEENKGWLTEAFVKKLAASVPGLDTGKFDSDLGSSTVSDIAAALEAQAQANRVNQTPFFLLGKTGDVKQVLGVKSLDTAAFRSAIDSLL